MVWSCSGLWKQTSEVRTLAPPLMGDVTPDKLLHLSVPWFLHLCNGCSGLIGLLELREVLVVTCLAHSKSVCVFVI